MRLPIRNYTASPITLFIEPQCDQHEIPPGGEAIVTLEDGRPHSIDLYPEQWISLWDEGTNPLAEVRVFPDQDHSGKR
jgi:hypothetical protein